MLERQLRRPDYQHLRSRCVERVTRMLGRWLARSGVLALVLTVTACPTVMVYETQRMEFDPTAETRSPSLEADHLSVKVSFQPQNMVQRDHYVLREGPFEFHVYVSANDRARGWLSAIEVTDGVVEARRRGGAVSRVVFRPTAGDWRRDVNTNFFGRERLTFALFGSKTPYIWDDFKELEEIRVRINFTGSYPDGERREYRVEQLYKPRLDREELNGFDLLMRQ